MPKTYSLSDKYQYLLSTAKLKQNLKTNSILGGINTLAAESINIALRIASMAVLARILVPEHFGLISMVTAITTFAERFKDLGLSIATIQQKKIFHEQVSTLFWINFGIGLLIMGIIACLSKPIADFYKEPRLIWIAIAISTSFLWGGLTVQHQAIMRRQMKFAQLAWISIISTSLSIMVGIIMAWQGFGYWALVWKELSRNIFNAIGTWLVCPWIPSLPTWGSGVGSMIKLGRNVTGFNIIHFFSRNLDQILIGKYWGSSFLAFYGKAYQLMTLPINLLQFPIDYVAEPTLSALQKEPLRYCQYYKIFLSVLAFLSMPIAIFLGIYSKSIILVVLGSQWLKCTDIFTILASAAFIQPVASSCGLVMVTCGKSVRYFWWGFIKATIIITAFVVGLHWGPVGVAAGYAIAMYSILIPSLWFSYRGTPVTISLFFNAISIPLINSILMGISLLFLNQYFPWLNSKFGIFPSLFLAILVYIGLWVLIPGGRQKIFEYLSYPISALRSGENV